MGRRGTGCSASPPTPIGVNLGKHRSHSGHCAGDRFLDLGGHHRWRPYGFPLLDPYSHPYTYCYTDGNTYAHLYPYSYSYFYSDVYPKADGNIHSDTYADSAAYSATH